MMGSRTDKGVMRKRLLEKTSEMDDRAARGWPTERSSSARCWRGRGGGEVSEGLLVRAVRLRQGIQLTMLGLT